MSYYNRVYAGVLTKRITRKVEKKEMLNKGQADFLGKGGE